LTHIVGAKEQSLRNLSFSANRKDLAARIHQLVRVVRQQVKVQSVTSELGAIEIAQTGANRDVASRQLGGRYGARIDVDRYGGQDGRKTRLPRSRGITCQTIQT